MGSTGLAQAQTNTSTDRAALVALYNAAGGANWLNNTNWLSDEPLSKWYGVTTDSSGRVTWLDLPSNGLSGEIPAELGGLSNLTYLDLFRNQLTGAVPSELSSLSNLEGLHISENQLTGAIPSGLGGLFNLEGLFLDSNQLSGEIPAELGDLSNLVDLFLAGNQLTGTIPPELGRLSNLEQLILAGNDLSGEIPAELGRLSTLKSLYLNDNSGLSGPLPGSFTSLTPLNFLDLSGTGLCAPTDASFQAWLENIATRLGVVNCREQSTGDPLIDRYDANNNGQIDRSEVIKAINDYLFGEGDPITRAEVIKLINLYLFAPSTPHNPPGAPEGLTAAGNGQTRIDLSWSAPPSDGGTAITGYRIEVSENGSTWTDLVANTGNAATSYSHTGLRAGSTRHYRVSAINSAGTGPASNIATGATDTSSGNQAPDLVVDTPTVDDSSPTAGESFTLSATVRNQGSGPSASTTLRYYRSADSSITSSDTAVGTDSVGGLAASGTSAEDIDLTAPSTAGTYYYGACVDLVSGESDATNNCSSGVGVTVSAAPTPAGTATSDRAAIIALYNSMGGPNWNNNANWLSDKPIGDWYGITTDNRGRIIRIYLHYNGLNGQIPLQFGDLDALEELGLTGIDGDNPDLSALSDLLNLRYLFLGGNGISDLSALTELPRLEVLDLRENRISDVSPLLTLLSSSNLRWLSLWGNPLRAYPKNW